MRISFDDLDRILADPDAFCAEVAAIAEDEKHIHSGRNAYMKNALRKWHSGAISEDAARDEVVSKCEHFQDKSESKRVLQKFEQYVEDYRNMEAKTHLSLFDVKVPLPKGTDKRFKITGQVRRLDRNPDGTYTAWIYSTERKDWGKGIRLPLLQDTIASKFNFDLDEIAIGIYCFADGSSQIFNFSQIEVDSAKGKLQQLLLRLAPLAEKEPPSLQTELDFEPEV